MTISEGSVVFTLRDLTSDAGRLVPAGRRGTVERIRGDGTAASIVYVVEFDFEEHSGRHHVVAAGPEDVKPTGMRMRRSWRIQRWLRGHEQVRDLLRDPIAYQVLLFGGMLPFVGLGLVAATLLSDAVRNVAFVVIAALLVAYIGVAFWLMGLASSPASRKPRRPRGHGRRRRKSL